MEWSPLVPALLASTSNDRSARVWDVDRSECIAVLRGHQQEARALAWHPELPNILFTGEARVGCNIT